jgi:hypothetical protein
MIFWCLYIASSVRRLSAGSAETFHKHQVGPADTFVSRPGLAHSKSNTSLVRSTTPANGPAPVFRGFKENQP